MIGDVGPVRSYVRGCAIHHTYPRAVALHGVHRALGADNAAFDVMGHAFFIEVR